MVTEATTGIMVSVFWCITIVLAVWLMIDPTVACWVGIGTTSIMAPVYTAELSLDRKDS